MVQCFSELQRIHQGMAVDVFFVMPIKVIAGKHEACDLFAVLPEPDVLKIATHTHEESTPEDVCGLKAGIQ